MFSQLRIFRSFQVVENSISGYLASCLPVWSCQKCREFKIIIRWKLLPPLSPKNKGKMHTCNYFDVKAGYWPELVNVIIIDIPMKV